MKSTVYGRKLLWCVNPISPDSSLVYYGHEVYSHKNILTPKECYYFIDMIRAGIRDGQPLPTVYEEFNAKDLRYLASQLPDLRVTLEGYARRKELNNEE